MMKTALFNRFELDLPAECVADCSHQGRCDEDVAHWAGKLDIQIPADDIRAELSEYGAWDDEELQDDEENIHRIIWIAACNIKEEENS